MEKLKTIKAVFEELQRLQMPGTKKELYETAKEIINKQKKGITAEELKKLIYNPENDWLWEARHHECSGYLGGWHGHETEFPIPKKCKACFDCIFHREGFCYYHAAREKFVHDFVDILEDDIRSIKMKLDGRI